MPIVSPHVGFGLHLEALLDADKALKLCPGWSRLCAMWALGLRSLIASQTYIDSIVWQAFARYHRRGHAWFQSCKASPRSCGRDAIMFSCSPFSTPGLQTRGSVPLGALQRGCANKNSRISLHF